MAEQKPTGWLGELYDIVSAYADDPAGEIERMAQRALDDGVINFKRYVVLQYRVPFLGCERETLNQVAERLGMSSRDRPRQLEFSACRKLKAYLPRADVPL